MPNIASITIAICQTQKVPSQMVSVVPLGDLSGREATHVTHLLINLLLPHVVEPSHVTHGCSLLEESSG
jgi:hypothetical protein